MSLVDLIGLIVLVFSSFAATNVDNLLLLVLMLGGAGESRGRVVSGFLVSTLCVVAISAIGLALGAWLNPSVVGYLGIIPLSLGLYGLYSRFKGKHGESALDQGGLGAGFVGSFTLMLGNSGDSLAVFMPLLEESSRETLVWIVVCYLLASGVWASR